MRTESTSRGDHIASDFADRTRLHRHRPRLDAELPRIVAQLFESLGTEAELEDEVLAILVDWATAVFESPRPRLIDRPTRAASWVVKRLLDGGLALVREGCLDTADGDYELARAIGRLFDGELTGLIARRESDLAASLANQALTDRMDAMQRLTGGFAHELRNAVNAARLQLELIERRSRAHATKNPAASALSEVQSIAELVDVFLRFARPSPLVLQTCDLVTSMSEVIDAERDFAHDRRVELRWSAEAAPMPITADAEKLTCACRELVRNAIEAASPDGLVRVEVGVTASSARLSVRDNGAGIAPELQTRIYEPFFSTRDHGRGLGLAIVHTFVSLHRGSIVLTSNERGTCFEVTIPRNPT